MQETMCPFICFTMGSDCLDVTRGSAFVFCVLHRCSPVTLYPYPALPPTNPSYSSSTPSKQTATPSFGPSPRRLPILTVPPHITTYVASTTPYSKFAPFTVILIRHLQEPLDLSLTYLHVEHHTLTCLPKSKAVMFCVRSYLYPIKDIKEEGNGPALAEACESMPERFGAYKRRTVWGAELGAWLRGDVS